MRDHRNPEKKAARITSVNPRASKAASPATIMMTPTVMVVIMATSFTEGFSSRKRNAKESTKASEEDLHMALEKSASDYQYREPGDLL